MYYTSCTINLKNSKNKLLDLLPILYDAQGIKTWYTVDFNKL